MNCGLPYIQPDTVSGFLGFSDLKYSVRCLLAQHPNMSLRDVESARFPHGVIDKGCIFSCMGSTSSTVWKLKRLRAALVS